MRTHPFLKFNRIALGACCICAAALGVGAQQEQGHRGREQVYRTITTEAFSLLIQRDARIDVITRAGAQTLNNLAPMAQLADESSAKLLSLRPQETGRTPVNDVLGSGEGMVLGGKSCEWIVRAYPSQACATVQLVFWNREKKPVRIQKLVPLAAEGLDLGGAADQLRVLSNGSSETDSDRALVSGIPAISQGNCAVFQPQSGRSLVAGFLSCQRAFTRMLLAPADKAPVTLEAECIYDPPVEVAPDTSLTSEMLYLVFPSTPPQLALEQFGRAVAGYNRLQAPSGWIPHGWDSWSTAYGRDIDEAKVLQNLDVLKKELMPFGWRHLAIDAGWCVENAEWEPDPARFPRGMKALAADIHDKGFTAGLWVDPFTVPANAPLAQQHPDWLVKPSAEGQKVMGQDKLILDATVPEAREHIRELAAKITQQWGFDALMEADFVYHEMLAESYHDPKVTRVEAMHLAMKALSDGMRDNTFTMTMAPPMLNALHAQGIRVDDDTLPVWRSKNAQGPWGCVDALGNAIRRYYFAPDCYVPDPDCAFFGHDTSRKRWNVEDQPKLTWPQSLAWFTGAALLGGVVKVGEPFAELNVAERDVLRKLLPSVRRPARPIDLFEDGPPRIWSLPVESKIGTWQIVGLFNWDEQNPVTIPLDFAALGLNTNSYYTVYEFWSEKYYGVAQGHLDVRVPPGSVMLLGLRHYTEHPMFLASNRHFTMGAMDHELAEWLPDDRLLHGRFRAVAGLTYRLRILAPEPYQFKEATTSIEIPKVTLEGRVVCMEFPATKDGTVDWQVQF